MTVLELINLLEKQEESLDVFISSPFEDTLAPVSIHEDTIVIDDASRPCIVINTDAME